MESWLSYIWPLPNQMPKEPLLTDAPCFSQYLLRDDDGPRGEHARRNLGTLTAKEAKSRAQQCKKKYRKFKGQMREFRKTMSEQVQRMGTIMLLYGCEDFEEGFPMEFPPDAESRRAFLNGFLDEHCIKQEAEGHQLYKEARQFYKTKAKEVRGVEKSLATSKKAAQRTMDEHCEIVTKSEWSPLNIPHILQSVLGFLTIQELDPVMRTCSQMLHFVHFQVPVSVTALDMGNQSFNKWLSSFHHFRFLDCISTKNMRKGSMYKRLSEMARSKRIDGLTVGQPASYNPKNFEMFQQIFQEHQRYFVELTVEASMIPCFLSDEQLGKLQKLNLLNLNKLNSNVTSWVEKLPSMEALEILEISSHDYSLQNVTLPENVRKLIVEESDQCIIEESDRMRKETLYRTDYILTLPNIQNCVSLEEIWIDGVQDLTSLSTLKNCPKLLQIRGLQSTKMTWPDSIHVEKLGICNSLPPPGTISTQQLAVAGIVETEEISRFLDANENLTALRVSSTPKSSEYPLESILQWENSMQEGATFELRRGYSLLYKYLLLEYAQDHTRCIIRGTPIAATPDRWFCVESSLCSGCGQLRRSSQYWGRCHCKHHHNAVSSEKKIRKIYMNRVQQLFRYKMGKKKRKRAENGSVEKQSRPLKKQRTDSHVIVID